MQKEESNPNANPENEQPAAETLNFTEMLEEYRSKKIELNQF